MYSDPVQIAIDSDIRKKVNDRHKIRLWFVKFIELFTWPFRLSVGWFGITFVSGVANLLLIVFCAMVVVTIGMGLRSDELAQLSLVVQCFWSVFFALLYFLLSYYACMFLNDTQLMLQREMESIQIRRNGKDHEENVLVHIPHRLARLYSLKKRYEEAARKRQF